MKKYPRVVWMFGLGLNVLLIMPRVVFGDKDPVVPITYDETYEGFHRKEFNELLAQMKVMVPSALALVTQRWGVEYALHHVLVVSVKDLPSKTFRHPRGAYVQSTGYGNGLRQSMVVDIEHYRAYPNANVNELVQHEMAHAVLRDLVAHSGPKGIPNWFNEGLAQSVTWEGRNHTRDAFARWGHSDAHEMVCDLNGSVDEFLHGEHNFGCYTYFYLTVKRLFELGGKNTLPTIITGLHEETPMPKIITHLTTLDWPAFQRDAEQYTLDVFAGTKPIP